VPTCTQKKLSVYTSSSSSKGVAAIGLSTSWLVRGSSRNCCDFVAVQGSILSIGYAVQNDAVRHRLLFSSRSM
jgi:hypothetical protein